MTTQFQFRRGTASEWTSANPVLASGELGFETDTQKGKIGNGSTAWNSLVYLLGAEVGDISAVTAGTGLTGGGTAGAVTLNVDTSSIATKDHVSATYVPTSSLGVTTATLNASGKLDSSQVPTTLATTTYADGILTSAGTYTDSSITTHSSDTTSVHGITDTTTLLTDSNTKTVTNKSISLGSNTVTSTLAQLNTAVSDADLASLAGAETLTNKTLTSPIVTGLIINDGSIVVEGVTANDFETTLAFTDPTGDRTVTFQDLTGTVALLSDISAATGGSVTETATQTLTNKTLTSPILGGTTSTATGNLAIQPATYIVEVKGGGSTDAAIQLNCYANTHGQIIKSQPHSQEASNTLLLPGGTTIGNANAVLVSDTGTQTLTNKSLTSPALTGTATAVNLTISGDLTVNGTTTNINSTNLVVEDKNIVLGDVATPSDTTADGGGITLKGLTDKTFNWADATDAWTSSEHINLASGKSLYLNGTLLKDTTETFTNKTLTLPKINENVEVTATATELNYVDGVTSAIQTQLNTKTAELYTFTTDATTARTVATGDAYKSLKFTSSSSITVSVPTDASDNIPVGTYIEIYQYGSGQITVAAVTPGTTTINATDAQKKSRVQFSSMTLIKMAANEWLLVGDTAA